MCVFWFFCVLGGSKKSKIDNFFMNPWLRNKNRPTQHPSLFPPPKIEESKVLFDDLLGLMNPAFYNNIITNKKNNK